LFIATIVLVVVSVVALSWAILQTYNVQTIGSEAHVSELHVPSADNPEFAQYLEQEKEYQAHFITLANSIKKQEQDRLTRALAITSIIAVIAGVLIATVAARKLTKPVIEAYESQERFVQDAAHELRNPLAALTAALQQTKQKSPLITIFKRQTNRLINITEDLLFLERKAKQAPINTNISDLLYDVIEEIQPIASKKRLRFNVEIEENIHKIIAPNDYVRLVRNIIDNAIKYTPASKTVSIMQRKEKHTIILQVTDEGIGIPQKELLSIGDRFFRASNTGNFHGTGLGLAIVKKILNTYGGNINIESKQNKGTKIVISLPA
jgi:two-component system, OmpR family, sensor histidine kinase CiaH